MSSPMSATRSPMLSPPSLRTGAMIRQPPPPALSEALTRDLREIGKDAHFLVRFAPGYQPPPSNDDNPTDAAHAAMARRMVAQQGFGINAVQRLPGNIGYLDVRGFGPTPLVADAYAAAMSLLSGTDALIVDMRRNGGGEPQSVTELASHLFAEADVRHLNDLYNRTDGRTVSYRTNPKVAVHYTRPVYVLTSSKTFSGGEEFAYDLQSPEAGDAGRGSDRRRCAFRRRCVVG